MNHNVLKSLFSLIYGTIHMKPKLAQSSVSLQLKLLHNPILEHERNLQGNKSSGL